MIVENKEQKSKEFSLCKLNNYHNIIGCTI
jgi:hypothetical protein